MTINTVKWFSLLLVSAILLTACGAPAAPVEPTGQPTSPLATQPPSVSLPESVKNALARQLGVAPEEITIAFAEKTEWPDACLGLPAEGELCAAVVTPGYGGMLEANGAQHEFRTNETGSVVRLISGPALNARQVLAQQLHLEASAITVVSVEQVEWPDGCLGVYVQGMACIQVITPGYKIILEANGRRYEYHTDATGSHVVLASAPEANVKDSALVWTQETNGVCQTAIVGRQSVVFGLCGGPKTAGQFGFDSRAEDLAYFVETYTSFQAETPAGSVAFGGQGMTVAAEAEQRMIAEWARLVSLEAASGHSGASWGLALAWHREGGIAGFCDDVSVYVTGDVFASSCASNPPTDLGHIRLSADRLKQLFAWVDRLKSFEFEQSDRATADAMTIRMVFTGTGSIDASDADKQAVQQFAADLFAGIDK